MHRRAFLKHAAFVFVSLNTPVAFAGRPEISVKNTASVFDPHIKDLLGKKRLFNKVYDEDIFLSSSQLPLLDASLFRLQKMQKIVGYGNFSLLNFDDAIKISKSYSTVGSFSKQELDFLEMLFYSRVDEYGFMGEKPIKTITGKIIKKEVKKIAHTGNYLYRGKPMEMYDKLKKEIGPDVTLTSGVRSIMKQFLLFLNKAKASNGNLSMASRSLAPPGYSFHGVGDFDVGKIGFGVHNFTEQFTRTDVYEKLTRLGYLKFRYEQNNNLGVRFEPWHIEVV
ncbi:MAG: M15 family metallopeptidase [Proteobacteria bacterium]|nr:M15 family metallopeptidase [Pseudomonadota bacterium]MBU1386333.1 M15 family metallopeptidase [Pseudomonadota bacterium]MBU1541381.1 M15 family metallopeptidase [Pseudomonadota bacterium]MBU2482494.1 M15 family metallopeptidase [Pseudomonadota bacterium]